MKGDGFLNFFFVICLPKNATFLFSFFSFLSFNNLISLISFSVSCKYNLVIVLSFSSSVPNIVPTKCIILGILILYEL